jgi:hypothetical protein
VNAFRRWWKEEAADQRHQRWQHQRHRRFHLEMMIVHRYLPCQRNLTVHPLLLLE